MNYKDTLLRFVKSVIITTALLLIIGLIFYSLAPADYYTPAFPYLLAFFMLASILVYHFMLKALEKRPGRFVNTFMLTTMAKLFIYLGAMITYALLNREDAMAFIVTFFIMYIVYTIVEVSALLRVNRDFVPESKPSQKDSDHLRKV
jgi:hypothetical protein